MSTIRKLEVEVGVRKGSRSVGIGGNTKYRKRVRGTGFE